MYCWIMESCNGLVAVQGFLHQRADPKWEPHELTPPFPEYPSGHSAMAGAIGVVLASLAGGDSINVTSDSVCLDSITGLPLPLRRYTSIQAMVNEAAWSRVYAGVHYLPSCLDGVKLGQEVGSIVLKNADF